MAEIANMLNGIFGAQTVNNEAVTAAKYMEKADERAWVLQRAWRAIIAIWGGREGIKVDEPGEEVSDVDGLIVFKVCVLACLAAVLLAVNF